MDFIAMTAWLRSLTGLELLNPWLLWLGVLIPIAIWLTLRRGQPSVRFAPARFLDRTLPRSWRSRLLPIPRLLQILGLLLAVIALARPVTRAPLPRTSEGIDILLCLDLSSSMAARDLDPKLSRLDVAKQAAKTFVQARPHDRIGLVCFARYPDLRCPLTLDHVALEKLLTQVSMVRADGPEDATGIGTAIALAAKVLKTGDTKSKVAILLTDGEENVATAHTPHEIAPLHAAQLCKELGVKLYAITAGAGGRASPDGRLSVDTGQVQKMAEAVGGGYFEARDAAGLRRIYGQIDQLEKVELEEPRFRLEDRFLPFLAAAILLIVGGSLLRSTLFEVMP
jgi:Ca-activated chloride channel family protein